MERKRPVRRPSKALGATGSGGSPGFAVSITALGIAICLSTSGSTPFVLVFTFFTDVSMWSMRGIPHLAGENSPIMVGGYLCCLCHISHKIIKLNEGNEPRGKRRRSDGLSGGDELPRAVVEQPLYAHEGRQRPTHAEGISPLKWGVPRIDPLDGVYENAK